MDPIIAMADAMAIMESMLLAGSGNPGSIPGKTFFLLE
jgi:hypothetical protein